MLTMLDLQAFSSNCSYAASLCGSTSEAQTLSSDTPRAALITAKALRVGLGMNMYELGACVLH